jgi:hypothetical protein
MPINVQRGRKYSSNLRKSSMREGVAGQHDGAPVSSPTEKKLPIVQKAGWAPESVWACKKYRTSTGIQSPDCQLIASRCTTYASPAVLLGVDEQENDCGICYALHTDAGFHLKNQIA